MATQSEDGMQGSAPTLVAQRVTGTVRRDAARLIQIQTEHETLLTTPEHPFARPHSGWIPAGRLVPGDWVVSARFGTVRVLSVQDAKPAHPERVFNLTVNRSHAYVVGTDQVLVHNRKCSDPEETVRELAEAERRLAELLQQLASPDGDKTALRQQIDRLRRDIQNLRAKVRRNARKNAEAEPNQPAPDVGPGPEAPGSAKTTREIEEIDRQLDALNDPSPDSVQRRAELKRRRASLINYRRTQRVREKKKLGIAPLSQRERLLKDAEADYESRTRQLEEARREAAELAGEQPRSDEEKKSHAERRAALEKKVKDLEMEQEVARELLDAERRVVELERAPGSTEAERQQIAQELRELKAMLTRKRAERGQRDASRRMRDDAQASEKRRQYLRDWWRRKLRRPAHLRDTERSPDQIETLQHELAARRREAGSGSRQEETQYLAERIETLEAIAEAARANARTHVALSRARAKRRALISAGKDTTEVDQKIARLEQERDASRSRYYQLSLREKVLAKLDGTTPTDRSHDAAEARLREFERELERELEAGGVLPDERLREIQDEVGEPELIDAEFLDSIWREAEAQEAAHHETVQEEADDVDAALQGLFESWERSPSPERTAAVESGLQVLQNELRQERAAVETSDFELANLHAFLSQTLGGPGSSHYAAGAQRLADVQQQRIQLRRDWRERMQRRLHTARQELQTLQSRGARDGLAEAELAQKIALLEHEVNNPSF